MDYSTYYYHGSKNVTTPRKSTGNIKGVELEINDYDAGYILDEMVDDNILTVPSNENNKKEYCIAVEDDGSVYKELILKASCNRTLLKEVKILEEYLNGNICNGTGTSCHIHINNDHLYARDIPIFSIVKASEFLAPILYKISGRDGSSYNEWACSCLESYISINDEDLFQRAMLVDSKTTRSSARYRLVNTSGNHTTELRIFSNYYNFNYDYIRLYIETVDFIIDLAEYMKDKQYKEEFNTIINMCKNFFEKRKYRTIYNKHNLNRFFMSSEERQIAYYNEQLQNIKDRFNQMRQFTDRTQERRAIELLRILRGLDGRISLPRIRFNIYDFNLNEIQNTITENIERQLETLEQ